MLPPTTAADDPRMRVHRNQWGEGIGAAQPRRLRAETAKHMRIPAYGSHAEARIGHTTQRNVCVFRRELYQRFALSLVLLQEAKMLRNVGSHS